MNRLLSVVRSRTDRSVELSRGVVSAAAYGESKELLEVDQIKNVKLTMRDGRSVGAKLQWGGFSAFLDGSKGAVCGPRCSARAGVALARRHSHWNRLSFDTLGSSRRSDVPP